MNTPAIGQGLPLGLATLRSEWKRALQKPLDSLDGLPSESPKKSLDLLLAAIACPAPESYGPDDTGALYDLPSNKVEPTDLEVFFYRMLQEEDVTSEHLQQLFRRGRDIRETTDRSSMPFLPVDSIHCLRDAWRTKMFAESISTSVTELAERPREDGKPLEILDAGCGAFPFMGIYAALCAKEKGVKDFHVTCIELDPAAAFIAASLVARFGLQDRVTILGGDIFGYYPEDKRFDLIVSETMGNAFTQESFSRIATHLKANAAKEDTIIIPSEVKIYATAVRANTYEELPQKVNIAGSVAPYLPGPRGEGAQEWTLLASYVPGDPLSRVEGWVGGAAQALEKEKERFKTSSEVEVYVILVSEVVLPGVGTLGANQTLISQPRPVLVNGYFKRYHVSDPSALRISYVPGHADDKVEVITSEDLPIAA